MLPYGKIQAEVGFDLLLPSQDPFFLNFKTCTPEFSAQLDIDIPIGK